MKSYLLVLFISSVCFFGCEKKILTSHAQEIKKDDTTTLKSMPFKIGAAVSAELLRVNTQYKDLVVKEFNSLTPENAMKFGIIHPAENYYNWPDADLILTLAAETGKRVHGHTLNWYADVPDWVKNFKGDTNAWENLLKNHIKNIVGHYKGKVASWDVVNEAFEDDGTLRNSIWVQKLGSDYIARAFQYAHEADPAALLFYNDYGQEWGYEHKSVKRVAILNMVNDFLKRGIPIHGIGLQMHTRYTFSDDNISLAIKSAAETGLKIHISELDVAMNATYDPSLSYSLSLEEMQAAKYKSIVKIYNSIPKSQQFGITTWNVSDGDSWVPGFFRVPDWPLPFNNKYQRKLAYQGILDGVK